MITNDDEINNNTTIPFERFKHKNLKIFKTNIVDSELMHNKFCVVDNSTVITGSYNWSYKAKSNFENIVITNNDNILANQFLDEFNKIIKIINPNEVINEEAFPLQIVVKRLEIIRNYILLDDSSSLLIESQKLSKYDFNTDILEIITLVNADKSNLVIPIIDNFIRQNQQVQLWIDKELTLLKTEVRKLENQINAFDNEKIELEKIITEFQHKHTIELVEIILETLKLLKLYYKNFKEKFNEAEEDEKQYQEQYNSSSKEVIHELTKKEKAKLKSKFRKATVLCHPDKVVNELKDIAKKYLLS